MPKATSSRKKTIGHNSLSADVLKGVLDRVANLEEEKATISADIKEVWAEAKGNGFDVPTMKRLKKIMDQDADERSNANALLETYANVLGIDPFS